jgi:putative tryptophan/tyrosine transport system ATP-binding protein
MLALDQVVVVHKQGRPDEVRALAGVTLKIPAGAFVTVVGANGAGKSSLVDVVAGTLRPTSGRVLLAGRDVTRVPDHRRAGRVARVFDDPRVGTAPELSVEDNLALAASRGSRRRLRFALSPSRRALLRERLAHLGLGLEDRLHDQVGLLSAGQRQSLTMVMAWLVRPDVLLLDEHLSALDPATAGRVLRLTADLVAEMRCATIMVTHNVDHALALGERLLVMSHGTVAGDLGGAQKRGLTAETVVELITRSGDAVSVRTLRRNLDPMETQPMETQPVETR